MTEGILLLGGSYVDSTLAVFIGAKLARKNLASGAWSIAYTFPDEYEVALLTAPTTPSTVIAVTTIDYVTYKLYRSTNGGDSFTFIANLPFTVRTPDMVIDEQDTIWALRRGGISYGDTPPNPSIYKSTDLGSTWTEMASSLAGASATSSPVATNGYVFWAEVSASSVIRRIPYAGGVPTDWNLDTILTPGAVLQSMYSLTGNDIISASVNRASPIVHPLKIDNTVPGSVVFTESSADLSDGFAGGGVANEGLTGSIMLYSIRNGPFRIKRSTDGGASVTTVLTPVNAQGTPYALAWDYANKTRLWWGLNPDYSAYPSGKPQYLLSSDDQGATWTTEEIPAAIPFLDNVQYCAYTHFSGGSGMRVWGQVIS